MPTRNERGGCLLQSLDNKSTNTPSKPSPRLGSTLPPAGGLRNAQLQRVMSDGPALISAAVQPHRCVNRRRHHRDAFGRIHRCILSASRGPNNTATADPSDGRCRASTYIDCQIAVCLQPPEMRGGCGRRASVCHLSTSHKTAQIGRRRHDNRATCTTRRLHE